MSRAKQLVRQQRAVWTDDKQNALRFAPGMEYKDTTMDDNASETVSKSSNVAPSDESWLNMLTEKRLHERKRFVKHSFAFIAGFVVMGIVMAFIDNQLPYILNQLPYILYYDSLWDEAVNLPYYEYQFDLIREMAVTLFILLSVVWTTAYIIHIYLYATSERATIGIRKRLVKKLGK